MIRYLFLAALGGVALLLLFVLPHERFSMRARVITAILVVGLIVCAAIFQGTSDDISANRRTLLLEFEQSKALKCGKISVSADKFNYEYGTASFVAKDLRHGGDAALAGVIISIDECEAQGAK